MSRFITRGRSASGAVTVQVAEKDGSQVVSRTHAGSAHTEADLAVLLASAESLLHSGQDALDLGDVGRSAPTGMCRTRPVPPTWALGRAHDIQEFPPEIA